MQGQKELACGGRVVYEKGKLFTKVPEAGRKGDTVLWELRSR